jgi:hypothetical protein
MGKPGNTVSYTGKPSFPKMVGKPGNIVTSHVFRRWRANQEILLLAMFLEGGQTRKHCFLIIFLEGEKTSNIVS